MCKNDTDDTKNNDQTSITKGTGIDEETEASFLSWPEDQKAPWSAWRCIQNWTYSYMNPLLSKGSRQHKTGHRLVEHDLFDTPVDIRSAVLAHKFRQHVQQPSDTSPVSRLLRGFWAVAAPTFVPAGCCEFVALSCQMALPLFVRELLQLLEANPASNVARQGIGWALGIFFCLNINAFTNHRHRHLAMKSGVAIRAAAVTVLYDHVLRLSPEGKVGLTSGEVTNLIATDTQKLYEVMQDGHLIWGLPLSVIVVTTCLLLVMGPTTLMGLAVLLLFVPLVRYVMTTMLAIRHQRAQWTDTRIKIVNSMIQGIKVTKLNNYEKSYEKRILEARDAELALLRKENAVWAFTLVLTVSAPVVATAAAFSLFVIVDDANLLTPSRSFSVLLLFSALRFPITYTGRLLGKMTQAYSALQRISDFLDRPTRKETASSGLTKDDDSVPLLLRDASFVASKSPQHDDEAAATTTFQVSTFDFSVKKGEVLAVCGPVGGGKSSLINGIIGDMGATSETVVAVQGLAALARQDAFIINATVRDNILFGQKYDKEFYEKVLDSCCLYQDLELLGPAQDLTEIGERGVTLSGGQKQRVALARAAYARPDIVMLDDPFSALDAGTGAKVFERLINGPDALFAKAAVILVTHSSHFIRQVNSVVLIVEGRNAFSGTWSDLEKFESSDSKVALAVDSIRSSVTENQEKATDSSNTPKTLAENQPDHVVNENDTKTNKLMTKEEREHGLASVQTWLLWFSRAGGAVFLTMMFLLLAVDRAIYVGVEYFLARWTEGAFGSVNILGWNFESQTTSRAAQWRFLVVYACIVVAAVVATSVRSEFSVVGGARAARKVFETMVRSVLHAPMYYFESTPMGRLLNRFSYDTEVIDVTLTQNMSMFLISISWYVAGVVVITSIVPWTLFAIIPVTVLYLGLLLHCKWLTSVHKPLTQHRTSLDRRSGSDLQRLDAVSRSPIQAAIGEGLDGASTIRVFEQTSNFTQKFRGTVDRNTSALLNFITAQRWLGLRIELLGSTIVLLSTILVVTLNGVLKIETGLVGLLVIWSGNFTITLGFLVDTFGEAEAAITAIERVDAMAHIPQENEKETAEGLLPADWPSKGELVFDNVTMRYRPGLPLALKGLNLTIEAGTRCGIVGRTGAGKSSLTTVLFRLVELESGSINLDGVNLSTIGLDDVRGRYHGMAIIPQDPFLTGDTIRQCIDPFSRCTDTDILEALKSVRLASSDDTPDFLNRTVDEGGSNYSTGERQLFFFAQTLLSNPRVLVLDEATSSTDGETDAFLQNMLRTKFNDTTLITVAHRLDTVIDYDQIVVLEEGKVAESGPPADLLAANGKFASLVDSAGTEASQALRAMAKQS